jgi:hypothetical protein
MNSEFQAVEGLEAELLRLNTLVRKRRAQLERLERCPNKDCECRQVWRESIEKNLAGQVGKIRTTVKKAAGKSKRPGVKAIRKAA